MTKEEIKFCKDCIHYKRSFEDNPRCRRDVKSWVDVISGKTYEVMPHVCEFERSRDHLCSEKAIYFVRKERLSEKIAKWWKGVLDYNSGSYYDWDDREDN
jgi:hypothetical protein